MRWHWTPFIRRAVLALAASCCAAAGHAAPPDRVTYILDWFPSGEETFPYVALRQGLFAREGLDVTIQIGRGSSDAITKIATGNAQFGSGGIGALMTGAAEHKDSGGVPVRAVLSIFNTPAGRHLHHQGRPGDLPARAEGPARGNGDVHLVQHHVAGGRALRRPRSG